MRATRFLVLAMLLISIASCGKSSAPAGDNDTAIQNVLDGKCILASLMPSWGAQICALAQSVDWR
jgi:hypothetical protein